MICSAQTLRNIKPLPPFVERSIVHGMSFGLSSCGYDVRVEFDSAGLKEYLIMHPNEFHLASTIERFNMPNFLVGVVHDKSSWARKGLAVQNTVIEPGWTGHLTLELTNHGNEMLSIRRGSPIAQILFHRLDEATERPYSGKYQAQERGPQNAREERGDRDHLDFTD